MTQTRWSIVAAAITILVLGGLAFEIIATQPVRGALRTCAELFTIANRPDLDEAERLRAARSLCSARYLRTHKLALAAEGGIVGVPRNLHKNFKAWREGPDVWICPTNLGSSRPVYRFVFEEDAWRFDGPAGLLHPWGEVIPTSDLPALE